LYGGRNFRALPRRSHRCIVVEIQLCDPAVPPDFLGIGGQRSILKALKGRLPAGPEPVRPTESRSAVSREPTQLSTSLSSRIGGPAGPRNVQLTVSLRRGHLPARSSAGQLW
jgi:hypothetical protein